MEKSFKLNAAKKFFNILLNREFVTFFGYRNKKYNPLLRTDFSASESERFSGIVTTVLRFSSDESQVIGGPVNCSNFWTLIWCKWLKSLEFTSWILVRIECTKIAGQILDSSERHCRICLLRSSCFWQVWRSLLQYFWRYSSFSIL